MLCIAHGTLWSEVTPENLLKFDSDGKVIEGEGQPEITAVNIHVPFHEVKANNHVVFHTHMPYATALTCT